jgi:hypothetical protein
MSSTRVSPQNNERLSLRQTIVNESLDEIGEALKAKGIILEDILESGDTIREAIAQKKYSLPK